MKKRTRLALGTAVLSAAVLLTAWKGSLDYLSIAAAGAVFGLPEIVSLAKVFLTRHDDTPRA